MSLRLSSIPSMRSVPTPAVISAFDLSHDDRERPARHVVEALRAAFPTEPEYDRLLTRKMDRRRETGLGTSYDMPAVLEALRRFLEAHVNDGFKIERPQWLAGGASKIQIGFTLVEHHAPLTTRSDLVLRMEPLESLNATSRVREREVLAAVADTVPVPSVRWIDEEGTWFPQPALIYSRVEGSAKPHATESRIGGIGTGFGPHRKTLAPQFVDLLARIHTLPLSTMSLPSYARPRPGSTDSATWQLNRARRVWEEDRGESIPLLDVAAAWLMDNRPTLDVASLVHGDYRGGNFLFDESTGRITAVLDWERSHIGDRHRDLAWTTLPAYGQVDPGTGEFLVTGLMPSDEFFQQYRLSSGLSVDLDRLRYYRILCCYQSAVTALGSAYRVSALGRSHQDVVIAGLEAPGQVMLDQLQRDLAEVL